MAAYRNGVVLVVMALLCMTACGPSNEQAAEPPAPAPAVESVPEPTPPAPPSIPPLTELPLSSIDSLMINRPQDEPDAVIIHVSGTAVSAGWTNVKLAEEPDAGGDGSVMTFKFVATSPEMPQTGQSPQQVETEVRIGSLATTVKTIRIITAGNEISAPVTQ